MLESDSVLFAKVCKRVKKILQHDPGCHDFAHTLRVLHNADLLLTLESPVHPFAVRMAAVLHDCARPEELESRGKLCHAQLGAEKAIRILRDCGCTDEDFIRLISDCVRTHRYRNKLQPKTLEAEIVYDADKLDSLGAFGIARAFHFAGREGACLHNTAEEALAGKEYSREDSAYREYLVKLRNLPFQMKTRSARKIALERARFMHDFFKRMNEEAGIQEKPDLDI